VVTVVRQRGFEKGYPLPIAGINSITAVWCVQDDVGSG